MSLFAFGDRIEILSYPVPRRASGGVFIILTCPTFLGVAINLFADDPVGGLVQVAIQRLPELLILRPEGAIHKRLGSPQDHRRIALTLVAKRFQIVAAAQRRE